MFWLLLSSAKFESRFFRYGNIVHIVLSLTARWTGYAIAHIDHCFAYLMAWPLHAILINVPKFMFGELRPNFLARCFFNETSGTSHTFSNDELNMLTLDIRDCPGTSRRYPLIERRGR